MPVRWVRVKHRVTGAETDMPHGAVASARVRGYRPLDEFKPVSLPPPLFPQPGDESDSTTESESKPRRRRSRSTERESEKE
jgi:hypothetical protein